MSAGDDKPYRIVPLATIHDRTGFSWGVESLDRYLKEQATQDQRRKANAIFVMVAEEKPAAILGYFTLCSCGLPPGAIPEEARAHLPRYPQVSTTLIGRLAISKQMQGQGLGGALLAEAIRTAYDNASIVGSSMVVVDAIDERAASFYAAHGFVRLPESLRLVFPMRAIGKLLSI